MALVTASDAGPHDHNTTRNRVMHFYAHERVAHFIGGEMAEIIRTAIIILMGLCVASAGVFIVMYG